MVWNMQKTTVHNSILKTTKQYFWQRDFQHREMSSYKIPLVQYNATNNKFEALIVFDAFCFMLNRDHDK